jgi:hypothetical protein
MKFKLDYKNLLAIVDDIDSFSQEEFQRFRRNHQIYFADKYPSKEEITNAFMRKNIYVGFTYDHDSKDCVFRLMFREEKKTIQDWNAASATK